MPARLRRAACPNWKPEKASFDEAVRRVWDAYLPIGEEEDLAFEVGTLLIELGLYAEALEFLEHSVRLYGVEPGTAYNRAALPPRPRPA